MDHDSIYEKVLEIVADTLDVDIDSLDESTELGDLGADSLDMLELVTACESEFDCEFLDESLEQIVTIGDAVDMLADCL